MSTRLSRPLSALAPAKALTALAALAFVVGLPVAASDARTADVLPAYASVRAALASDDLGAAKKAAVQLKATAGAAASGAAHPAKHQLHAVVSAAERMSSAADLAAARVAFGDASKALITRLAGDAALAKGVIVYRCPMTKTYKKWVQLAGPMANPYMGQRMLHCGSKVPVAP